MVVLAVYICLSARSVTAQSFDLDRDRQAVVSLDGLWRFHPGDDARWAEKDFDDSQWPLLRSDRDWGQQGFKDLKGFGWYRFKVTAPAGSGELSLYLSSIRGNYELYVDGVRVGGLGVVSPGGKPVYPVPKLFALPQSVAGPREMTVALRVWLPPGWLPGGSLDGIAGNFIGDTKLLARREQADINERSWSQVDTILMVVLDGLAGLAGLAFFFIRVSEREYLWFGLLVLNLAFTNAMGLWDQDHATTTGRDVWIAWCFGALFCIWTMLFFQQLTGAKRRGFFWTAIASSLGIAGVGTLASVSWVSLPATNVATLVLLLPFIVWTAVTLARAAWEGVADARLLLIPILFQYSSYIIGLALVVSYSLGWQHRVKTGDPVVTTWPFTFTVNDLAGVLFLVTMLAILLKRFTRSRREEERYAGEVEAARIVQQVLLPEPHAGLKGFRIEAEYLPAQEVGGDFYQIIPTADGGLMMVTGDVSGKGMPAAMLVAMLVGAIRTETAHTSNPSVLLETLNRWVYGRMNDGFATCVALHLLPDGMAAMASAGNPSPYLNGEELELAGALPLGMMPEVTYPGNELLLRPGDGLTFVSDGVLEAVDAKGEFFGFERARAVARLPAAEIAEQARSFGQSDDITVVSVVRCGEAHA